MHAVGVKVGLRYAVFYGFPYKLRPKPKIAEKGGVISYSYWRQRVGEDHHAAESRYAAAEILFEMLAQLLGDGGVRLSGQ